MLQKWAMSLALCSVALAAPAAAREFVATYTGIVSDGLDISGHFGGRNNSLVGLTAITRYRYNADPFYAAPGRTLADFTLAYGYYEERTGGTTYGFSSGHSTSPILGASITINGVTRNFDPLAFSHLETSRTNVDHIASTDCASPVIPCAYARNSLYEESGGAPTRLAQNYSFASGYSVGSGFFQYGFRDTVAKTDDNTHGSYDVLSYTVSGGVPEPTTWAMLVVGLGFVGVAIRRKVSLAEACFRGSAPGSQPLSE